MHNGVGMQRYRSILGIESTMWMGSTIWMGSTTSNIFINVCRSVVETKMMIKKTKGMGSITTQVLWNRFRYKTAPSVCLSVNRGAAMRSHVRIPICFLLLIGAASAYEILAQFILGGSHMHVQVARPIMLLAICNIKKCRRVWSFSTIMQKQATTLISTSFAYREAVGYRLDIFLSLFASYP